MLVLGIIVLVIGACVAAFVHHTIGIVIAVIGAALVLWALLVTADAAMAATLLLPLKRLGDITGP